MTRETDLQVSVFDYLHLKKVYCWRNNNIPVYDATRKCYRAMPKETPKGLPDIFIIRQGGKLVGLELKNPKTETQAKTYLSKEQKIIRAEFEEVGAEYHTIRTIDEVMALF